MKFLIVDDSPTTRRLTISVLKTFGYKDFTEASDGVEALKKLKKKPIDIIFTDWNMPNLDGLELTNVIRSDEELKNIPIILCTTRGDKEDIVTAVKSKVNGYIVKPFTPKIIEEKVKPIIDMLIKVKELKSNKKDLSINLSIDRANLDNFNNITINYQLQDGKKTIRTNHLTLDISNNEKKVKKLINTLVVENNKIFLKSEVVDKNNNTIEAKIVQINEEE